MNDIEIEVDGTNNDRIDIQSGERALKGINSQPTHFVRIPKGKSKVKVGSNGIFINGKKAKIEKYEWGHIQK